MGIFCEVLFSFLFYIGKATKMLFPKFRENGSVAVPSALSGPLPTLCLESFLIFLSFSLPSGWKELNPNIYIVVTMLCLLRDSSIYKKSLIAEARRPQTQLNHDSKSIPWP
jgi:hypothetical protein